MPKPQSSHVIVISFRLIYKIHFDGIRNNFRKAIQSPNIIFHFFTWQNKARHRALDFTKTHLRCYLRKVIVSIVKQENLVSLFNLSILPSQIPPNSRIIKELARIAVRYKFCHKNHVRIITSQFGGKTLMPLSRHPEIHTPARILVSLVVGIIAKSFVRKLEINHAIDFSNACKPYFPYLMYYVHILDASDKL